MIEIRDKDFISEGQRLDNCLLIFAKCCTRRLIINACDSLDSLTQTFSFAARNRGCN